MKQESTHQILTAEVADTHLSDLPLLLSAGKRSIRGTAWETCFWSTRSRRSNWSLPLPREKLNRDSRSPMASARACVKSFHPF